MGSQLVENNRLLNQSHQSKAQIHIFTFVDLAKNEA